MSPLRSLGLAGIVLLSACHLEDHTPTGSRKDEAQIREVVFEFYRGLAALDWGNIRNFFAPGGNVSYLEIMPGDSTPRAAIVSADSAILNWARLSRQNGQAPREARVIRADLRQVNGVAAVWVVAQVDLPFQRNPNESPDGETVEHFVLHRTGDGWRIVLLSLPWAIR